MCWLDSMSSWLLVENFYIIIHIGCSCSFSDNSNVWSSDSSLCGPCAIIYLYPPALKVPTMARFAQLSHNFCWQHCVGVWYRMASLVFALFFLTSETFQRSCVCLRWSSFVPQFYNVIRTLLYCMQSFTNSLVQRYALAFCIFWLVCQWNCLLDISILIWKRAKNEYLLNFDTLALNFPLKYIFASWKIVFYYNFAHLCQHPLNLEMCHQ